MKTKKKPKPQPTTLEVQPTWNLGRHARITITTTPTPKFLELMVVKAHRSKGE